MLVYGTSRSLKYLALACALSSACLLASAQQSRKKVAISPPVSCGIPLASVSSATGSDTYLRLRYLVQALITAQDSVGVLSDAVEELNKASTPALALAPLLSGSVQAEASLRCSAYLINTFQPHDSDDKMIKVILIDSFNREADTILKLKEHTKEQFLRSAASSQSRSTQFHDAERMASMTKVQHEAAENLLQTTSFILAKSVDMSDANAKTTPFLSLTCKEYADLVERLSIFENAEKSAYSDCGSLVRNVVNEHKCRS